MSEDHIAREVVVRGLVQGVFFRDSCRRAAAAAGVAGWVRNEPDGSVRALFEGPPDAVERMIAWSRRGPSRAVVERVDALPVDPTGRTGFDVR